MINLHDSEIISYNVNLKKKEISLETVNDKDEVIIVVFKDVLVHLFETELPNSIIFDIEEFDTEKMIEENIDLLEKNKNYCWPIPYNSIDELIEELNRSKYKYYVIDSSYGLSGWILAKSIQVKM